MTQWTGVARELLEDHFAKMRLDVERSGADADEVFEDLRERVGVHQNSAFRERVMRSCTATRGSFPS